MESPSTPAIDIGSRRELFVDRLLIDRLEHASLRLHEPISGGVAMGIDRPWEAPNCFGSSMLRHQGRWLLYYRSIESEEASSVLCVAQSDDGVVWRKPALGRVASLQGRNDTNILGTDPAQGNLEYSSTPWVDARPGVPADQAIKAMTSEPLSGEKHTAYADPAGPKRLAFWGSADGLFFRRLGPPAELISRLPNSFDGGVSMSWSEAEGCYVLYFRCWGPGGRSMARATSPDLARWSEPVVMGYGGGPVEQFYVNNTQPYFRAPHIYLAPAARFMEGRRVITDQEADAIRLQKARGLFYGNDCSDGVLLTTRAGSTHYDRTFPETFIRPGLGASNWVSRTNYPLHGIEPISETQLMMLVTRGYMQPSWHIERLLLRTDGFASVSAPWSGGTMLTRPLTFSGERLEINYRTSAAGFVRVEMLGADGAALPGLALEDCPEIIGDQISRTVAWKGGPEVGRAAGRPVRLRFVMKDADLFSLRFAPRG